MTAHLYFQSLNYDTVENDLMLQSETKKEYQVATSYNRGRCRGGLTRIKEEGQGRKSMGGLGDVNWNVQSCNYDPVTGPYWNIQGKTNV